MAARNAQAILLALAAVLLWATVASGFKLGLRLMSPLQLLWLGTIFSTLTFFLVPGRAVHRWPDRREWWPLVAFGCVNPVIYYLVLFEAYDRLPAQVAQPLNYTWAIALGLLAVPLLRQPLTARQLGGMLVGYAGVVVLLWRPGDRAGDALDPVGIILALLSTLLWAGYWVMNTKSDIEPQRLLAWSFLIATPVLTLLCALFGGLPSVTLEHLSYGAWVGLIEMGLTFLLWQAALRMSSNAALIGQLIFLSPFLSLVLIGRLVGESIAASSWLGLGIIVTGLLLSGRPANPE